MIKNKDIFDFLCEKYPLETACDFDNPGFLVGDLQAEVSRVLVALDCDILTVKDAVEIGANLIITHHPVIFNGLKSVTDGDVVFELIKNNISVISMHTNLDVAKDGVTERLCEEIELFDIKEFRANDGFIIRSAKSSISNADELAKKIKEKLGGSVKYIDSKREIKNVLVCSGSGGDYYKDAFSFGYDALITADVKHNVLIDALNAGITVFDCGHFESENIITKPLCELLKSKFGEIAFETYYPNYLKTI